MARTTDRSWEDSFIAKLRELPVPEIAAEQAGVSIRTVQRRRKQYAEFRDRYDDALALAIANVEVKLYGQAMQGRQRAMEYWLRHHKPEVYGDRAGEQEPEMLNLTIRYLDPEPVTDAEEQGETHSALPVQKG